MWAVFFLALHTQYNAASNFCDLKKKCLCYLNFCEWKICLLYILGPRVHWHFIDVFQISAEISCTMSYVWYLLIHIGRTSLKTNLPKSFQSYFNNKLLSSFFWRENLPCVCIYEDKSVSPCKNGENLKE